MRNVSTQEARRIHLAGRANEDFAELARRVTEAIEHAGGQQLEPTSVRRKLGKYVIELQPSGRQPSGVRRGTLESRQRGRALIGKIDPGERGRRSWQAQQAVWDAGFRPPSRFTVAQPLGYLEESGLFLQEKAEGGLLVGEIAGVQRGWMTAAAEWLAALHSADLRGNVESRGEEVRKAWQRYCRELCQALPAEGRRIETIGKRGEIWLSENGATVPSHGDYHPENVLIAGPAGSLRVAVIDFANFGLQPREADAGYMLAQTAIMGYFRRGHFGATSAARGEFLRAYQEANPREQLSLERVAAYAGMAFLQSLHFELCVLHTNEWSIVGRWLGAAESCLLGERVETRDVDRAA